MSRRHGIRECGEFWQQLAMEQNKIWFRYHQSGNNVRLNVWWAIVSCYVNSKAQRLFTFLPSFHSFVRTVTNISPRLFSLLIILMHLFIALVFGLLRFTTKKMFGFEATYGHYLISELMQCLVLNIKLFNYVIYFDFRFCNV